MNIERAILVAFLGNYLINTVIAALVALVPSGGATGMLSPQYITFVVLAVIMVALLTWWYMRAAPRTLKGGILFGVTGFVVAIVAAFVTGVSGVLAQTGSFSSVAGVIPNFWPFLANWSTLVLVCYWVLPAAIIGWWKAPKMASARPMGSM